MHCWCLVTAGQLVGGKGEWGEVSSIAARSEDTSAAETKGGFKNNVPYNSQKLTGSGTLMVISSSGKLGQLWLGNG